MKKLFGIFLCAVIFVTTLAPVGVSAEESLIELTESGVVTIGKTDAVTEGDYALTDAMGASTDFFNTEFLDRDGNPTGAYTIGHKRFIDYKLNAPVPGKYRVSVTAAHAWRETGYKMGYYLNKILCAESEKSLINIERDRVFSTTALFEVDLHKGENELRLFVETSGGQLSIRNFQFERTGESEQFSFLAADFDSYNMNAPSIWLPYDGLYDDKTIDEQPNYGKTKAEIGSSGRYMEYNVYVPKTGAYRLSGTMGGAGSDFAVIAFAADGTKTTLTTVFEDKARYRDNVGFIYLQEGETTLRLQHTGETGTLMFVEVVFTYLAAGKITGVYANEAELSATVPRGTDRFVICCSNDFSEEALSAVSVTAGDGTAVAAVKSIDKADAKKMNIDLSESLDFEAAYNLAWQGLKDAYGYRVADDSFGFTASDAEGDAGTASIVKDSEKSKVQDKEAVIAATMLGSAGKPIAGRAYRLSKLVKPDGTEVTTELLNGISGENGAISIHYTFPTEGFGSGTYQFYLLGEYVTNPEIVELSYLTASDKAEILGAFKTMTKAEEVKAHLANEATQTALAIHPTVDLVGLTDVLAFYMHFTQKVFADLDDFKTAYNTYIALERINQATTVDEVTAVLENKEQAALLGLDTEQYALLDRKKADFLAALLDLEAKATVEALQEAYHTLLNQYLLQENAVTVPTLALSAEDVRVGQDIVLTTSLAEKAEHVSRIVLRFAAEGRKIAKEAASFTSDKKATVTVTQAEDAIQVSIVYQEPGTVDAIGTLHIVSEYGADTTVKYLSAGTVYYDLGIGQELFYDLAQKEAAVQVSKASNTGSTGTSSRGGQGGGSSSVKPSATPKPPVQTPTEIKTPFTDLAGADWAKESIAKLYVKGVVSGDGDHFFPDRLVTRAEFTKMLVLSLGLLRNDVKSAFTDVSEENWSYIYAACAKEAGLVTGDPEGRFNGEAEISREDMCVMLYRAWKLRHENAYEASESFSDEAQINEYAKEAVYAMRSAHIVNGIGDNRFAPKMTATRAMAAKVIAEFMEGMNV